MLLRTTLFLTLCTLAFAARVDALTATIGPNESVQESLDALSEGDTLQLRPGRYSGSVTMNTKGVALVGLEEDGEYVLFDGRVDDGDSPDFAVRIGAEGVTIANLHIRNYKTGAVLAYNHDNVTIRDLDIANTGMFGILSGKAENLSVSRCVIRDASDTAMAMDLIRNVTLDSLELYENAIGVGVFDCTDVVISNSSFHHNNVGIAMDDKGDKEIESSHVRVSHCRFVGNGTSQYESEKPMHGYRGVGLFVLGFTHVEVSDCFFDRNATYGLMVSKYVGNDGEVLSTDAHVHDNAFRGNGSQPSKRFTEDFSGVPGGDLYWDGLGTNNRFQDNGDVKAWLSGR